MQIFLTGNISLPSYLSSEHIFSILKRKLYPYVQNNQHNGYTDNFQCTLYYHCIALWESENKRDLCSWPQNHITKKIILGKIVVIRIACLELTANIFRETIYREKPRARPSLKLTYKNAAAQPTIHVFIYETVKYDYLWRWSTISGRISRKLSDPIDFQPKFLDFWLYGKRSRYPYKANKVSKAETTYNT